MTDEYADALDRLALWIFLANLRFVLCFVYYGAELFGWTKSNAPDAWRLVDPRLSHREVLTDAN